MRAQIQEIVKRLQEAAEQLNGFDNLMHETLHGIADDLEAAIRPQWVPVAERLPEHSNSVFLLLADGDTTTGWNNAFGEWIYEATARPTHWHEIDYPEPPEVQQQ